MKKLQALTFTEICRMREIHFTAPHVSKGAIDEDLVNKGWVSVIVDAGGERVAFPTSAAFDDRGRTMFEDMAGQRVRPCWVALHSCDADRRGACIGDGSVSILAWCNLVDLWPNECRAWCETGITPATGDVAKATCMQCQRKAEKSDECRDGKA